MSVKYISKNKYRITIELGYDAFGNRKRMYKTFNGSKEEAIQLESQLMKKYYHIGRTVELTDITFKEYTELYIKKYCVQNIAPITLSKYLLLLKNINAIIGNRKLRQISSLILDDMYSKLWYGRDGRVLTYNSQYGYYKLVRAMFNKAVNWGLVLENPNDKVNNKPRKEHKEKRCYNVGQVKVLLNALENEHIMYKMLIMLAIDSGARRGELCALRWSDISFSNRTMSITKSLKTVGKQIYENKPKTDASIREVLLSDSTIKELKAYKLWQDDYKAKIGESWKEENRLFTARDGGPICLTNCDHILRKVIKKYNLPPLCFHELRHTCCSLLLNSNIDPKTVSKRLGHATTNMVMEIYGHSFDSSKLECANRLNEILK